MADLAAQVRALEREIQDRALVKDFNPSSITGGTPDIFASLYRDINILLFYRNLATFLRSSPSASPEFPLIKYDEPRDDGRLLWDQLFTDADPDRPEVNPFNLTALGCQAFFGQHPSVFEYFASVGCANWFGGYISNFHLDRARRFFLAAIEQCHGGESWLPLTLANFTAHAFEFLRMFRETFITSASANHATAEDTLERLIKAFVDSIPALSADHIAVWRAALTGEHVAIFAKGLHKFLLGLLEDWLPSPDFATTDLLVGYGPNGGGLYSQVTDSDPVELLRPVIEGLQVSGHALPTNLDSVAWSGIPVLMTALDAEILNAVARSAGLSGGPGRDHYTTDDIVSLALRVFERKDNLGGAAPRVAPGYEGVSVTDQLKWAIAKSKAEAEGVDVLSLFEQRLDVLKMVRADLDASQACVAEMRQRLDAWGILASIDEEVKWGLDVAFLRHAISHPIAPPLGGDLVVFEGFREKALDVLIEFVVGVIGANVQKSSKQELRRLFVEDRDAMVGEVSRICQKIRIPDCGPAVRRFLPLFERWLQAYAISYINGTWVEHIARAYRSPCGRDKAAVKAEAAVYAGFLHETADVLTMYLSRYQLEVAGQQQISGAGSDIIGFARISRLLDGLKEAVGTMTCQTDPLREHLHKILAHLLFVDRDPPDDDRESDPKQRAKGQRSFFAEGVATAVRQVDLYNRFLTPELRAAIGSLHGWFSADPLPTSFT
jgi:hypothetical protein